MADPLIFTRRLPGDAAVLQFISKISGKENRTQSFPTRPFDGDSTC